MSTVGIDLGTTNSAIAYVNEYGKPEIILNSDGSPTTPSVIMFDGNDITVGQTAKDFAIATPDKIVAFIKREMGEPDYEGFDHNGRKLTPEEISARILMKLKQDAEERVEFPIKDAVITVPAYFDDPKRRATMQAGEIAGLNVKKIINEPTAAAVAFGLLRPEHHNQTVLVYDLGGGTFDVTVLKITESGQGLKFDIIATDGDHQLGGKDIDDKIMEHVVEQFLNQHGLDPTENPQVKQDLRDRAEKAKIHLASKKSAPIVLSASGYTSTVMLKLDKLNELIAPTLQLTHGLIERCLEKAGLSTTDVDTILLIGGSTKLRAVRQLVVDMFGKEPDTSINPDEAVAVGAAIVAQTVDDDSKPSIGGIVQPIIIEDVTSHGLGIRTVESNSEDSYNHILIPKNTKLPGEGSDSFVTRNSNQTSVVFPVVVGDERDLKFCTEIGQATITDLPAGRPAGMPLMATLKYNVDGIVEITAVDVKTGKSVNATIEHDRNLSSQQIEDAQKALEQETVE